MEITQGYPLPDETLDFVDAIIKALRARDEALKRLLVKAREVATVANSIDPQEMPGNRVVRVLN